MINQSEGNSRGRSGRLYGSSSDCCIYYYINIALRRFQITHIDERSFHLIYKTWAVPDASEFRCNLAQHSESTTT